MTSVTRATSGTHTATTTPSTSQAHTLNTVRAIGLSSRRRRMAAASQAHRTRRHARVETPVWNQAKSSGARKRRAAGVVAVMASTARMIAAAVYEVCSSPGNVTPSGWTMPVQ